VDQNRPRNLREYLPDLPGIQKGDSLRDTIAIVERIEPNPLLKAERGMVGERERRKEETSEQFVEQELMQWCTNFQDIIERDTNRI
jgi:hypothetical protein